MNWKSVIRFRKQVEDMVREELALAEWEKSQEQARRESLQEDMHQISLELEDQLPHGVSGSFVEERFRWLEEAGYALERQTSVLAGHDQKIAGIRDKLREAYQARRVIEILSARQRTALMRRVSKYEQRQQEEAAAFRYVAGWDKA